MPLQPGSSSPTFNPSLPQPSRLRASWGTEGAEDCGKSPLWSNLHRPSWFLPRAELGLCNCSLDGPACRAVHRSTALPWRWAVPGVSWAGALTRQVCMGTEGGGGGGRCFGLGTGLSSRGSVQKNMPARERFGSVLQGLNVQDPTNHEGELLLFATHTGTAPHESARAQLHGSCTLFTPGSRVDTSSRDTNTQHPPLCCCPTPSWDCPPHLKLTQFPGTEPVYAPLLHASFSPRFPLQHPTPSCPTTCTLSLPQPPLHPIPEHLGSVLTWEHSTLSHLQLRPTLRLSPYPLPPGCSLGGGTTKCLGTHPVAVSGFAPGFG